MTRLLTDTATIIASTSAAPAIPTTVPSAAMSVRCIVPSTTAGWLSRIPRIAIPATTILAVVVTTPIAIARVALSIATHSATLSAAIAITTAHGVTLAFAISKGVLDIILLVVEIGEGVLVLVSTHQGNHHMRGKTTHVTPSQATYAPAEAVLGV